MAEVVRSHSKKFLTLALLFVMGSFWFSLVDTSHGAQVSNRSDVLNNSNVSATSNHAISFTTYNALTTTSTNASSTLTVSFPVGFDLTNIYCKNVDISYGTATSASDNFNRANGNLGVSWNFADSNLQISSNQVVDTDSSGLRSGAIWYSQFSADQYAQLTLSSLGSNNGTGFIDLFLRLSANNAEPSTLNGYLAEIILNGASSSATINRYDAGTQTTTQLASKIFTPSAGDVILFQIVGSQLAVFQNGTQLTSATDGTYVQSGYTGFGSDNFFGTSPAVDDWVAGTVTPAIAGYNVNRSTSQNCPGSATSWGLLISGNALTFYTPTSTGTYVATGTQIKIFIGSNASIQEAGTAWITNPSSAGTYTETVGGTFGGSGNILVSINQASQLSATVAETLTFAINGLPITPSSGTDKMSGCDINYLGGGLGTDDEDNRSLANIVTTTAAAVPFGIIAANNGLSQGCQLLSIQTNAGSGYSITSRENNPLETAGGLIIDDTTCSTGTCTPTTAASYTGANTGLAISCVNSATSVSCSTANPNWNNGSNWAPISAESKHLSPAKFSGVSSATSALVLSKVKYRLQTVKNVSAGTYTNLVSFIATPVY